MEEPTLLEKLDEKIIDLIATYNHQKDEIEVLRHELMTLKTQNEVKDNEIQKLNNENSKKDIEIENIIKKIELLLG